MLYREDKYGNKISQLGYGCMRFTRKGNSIDYAKAEKEILHAIEGGINYFDTAYLYPGSEETLGKILANNNVRDKVYIATKLPQYMLNNMPAIERTFKEELRRLQTDHIDYYLMHMVTDFHEWEKLKSLGIIDFINEHKKDGSIRQIGFSYHGDTEMFLKVLNDYDWDFCQIQYNYLDENSQAGRKGLEAAHAKGIPVIIMEPLRGGKLVNMLPNNAKDAMKNSSRDYSPAEWSFRWLWDQEGVSVILSGMNSIEMLDENLKIASEAAPNSFTEEDHNTIAEIVKAIRSNEKVGCTGCRYCMPCPKGVDIPGYFYYYNMSAIENKSSAQFGFTQNMALRKEPCFATQCINCGKCKKHCPQHIDIPEELKKADKVLRPPLRKLTNNMMRAVFFRKGSKK
ncbi:MAG: aldo/keto reductase [Saccharofermentans sp.]|nr:aldo/keto reductase [Saccharofermentans sp.]